MEPQAGWWYRGEAHKNTAKPTHDWQIRRGPSEILGTLHLSEAQVQAVIEALRRVDGQPNE